MQKTKVVACVISRMESTRLPSKVLIDLLGKPMNQWLVERLKTCQHIDEIVICTAHSRANERLVEAAAEWHVKCHQGPETDVLKRIIEAGERHDATHIIRITGDNIFTDPQYLDRLIAEHISQNAEYSRVNGLPVGMTGEVMSMSMAKHLHANLSDSEQTEYMVLYAYNPDVYKCLVTEADEKHRRPYYAITIDTPADLEMVREIIQAHEPTELGPNIDEIIAWLDANPQKRIELKDDTPIRMPYGEMITYAAFMDMMNQRAAKAQRLLNTAKTTIG